MTSITKELEKKQTLRSMVDTQYLELSLCGIKFIPYETKICVFAFLTENKKRL